MSTHKYSEAIEQLLATFASLPELAGIQVVEAFPGANPRREIVAVGTEVTFNDDWAPFGRLGRESNWTTNGFVSLTTPGMTRSVARERCMGIISAMARAVIGTASAVTLQNAVMWSAFRATKFGLYPTEEGVGAFAEFSVDGKARWTFNT